MTNSKFGLTTAASACAILAISTMAAQSTDLSIRFAQAPPDSKSNDVGDGKQDEKKKPEEKKDDKGAAGNPGWQNPGAPNAGQAGGAPKKLPPTVNRPQILNPNAAKPNDARPSNGEPDAGKAKKDAGGSKWPSPFPKPNSQPTGAPKPPPDQKAPEKASRPETPPHGDQKAVRDKEPPSGGHPPSNATNAPKSPSDQKPPEKFARPDGQKPDDRDAKQGDAKAGQKPATGQQWPGALPTGAAKPAPEGVPQLDGWKRPNATIEDIKSARKERREEGGKRLVIEEPDKRTIVEQDNRISIERDERERMRRFAPNARVERGPGGNSVSIIERGDAKIYSETDERGRLVRRYRRDGAGRETIIIDNRRRRSGAGRDLAIGVGAGVVAGAVLLDSLVRVPAPRVTIPREKYILRGEGASDDEYYEALSAPPVERYDDRYTLDEIRATPRLRERMRRIDLDDVNFAFGAWDIDPSQYGKLERLARAIKRVLQRDPDEVFLIEGHTDAVGSRVDNLTLSDRRAETVAYILTKEFGVPFESLVTQGYGEEYLKVQTDAPDPINRRVAARRITPLLARDLASRAADAPPRADRDGRSSDDGRYDDRGGQDDGRGAYDGPADDPGDEYDDRDGPPR